MLILRKINVNIYIHITLILHKMDVIINVKIKLILRKIVSTSLTKLTGQCQHGYRWKRVTMAVTKTVTRPRHAELVFIPSNRYILSHSPSGNAKNLQGRMCGHCMAKRFNQTCLIQFLCRLISEVLPIPGFSLQLIC